ncbi:MAG: dinitrogenase iron-molybdenum cofactor biosynthesis protein [Desulfobacterales bacterium]|nr:dinitrogenase iron-molybdenum cofactor biosynthesis protein [Desulfobacterales bacterium]
MKIAISATGKDLDCRIDTRFGRCAHFILVETDDMSYEAFDNQNAALSGSAGIQSASFVASKGAQCVLTGNCGPKAAEVFSSTGIDVYTGQQGTVRDAVENFKKGGIEAAGTNVPEKFGVAGDAAIPPGAAASFGRGMGMGGGRRCAGGGRGMGMGGGRGMGMGGGRGMGKGRGMAFSGTADAGASGAETVEQLKQQARNLKQEMEAIETRIKELE